MIAKREQFDAIVSPRLTCSQMRETYPGRWLVIDQALNDEAEQLACGVVIWHGPDRDEAFAQPARLDLIDATILFTGPVPSHIRYAL